MVFGSVGQIKKFFLINQSKNLKINQFSKLRHIGLGLFCEEHISEQLHTLLYPFTFILYDWVRVKVSLVKILYPVHLL